MFATVGVPADFVITQTSKTSGAELTSYFGEANAALLLALDWARTNCPTELTTIYSINQSLAKAMHGDTQYIRPRLDKRKGPAIVIWIPGHKAIPGNKAVFELVKADATVR